MCFVMCFFGVMGGVGTDGVGSALWLKLLAFAVLAAPEPFGGALLYKFGCIPAVVVAGLVAVATRAGVEPAVVAEAIVDADAGVIAVDADEPYKYC